MKRYGPFYKSEEPPHPSCRYVRPYHTITQFHIKLDGVLSHNYEADRGLKEGCPSSPPLFILYHQAVLHDFRARRKRSATAAGLTPGIYNGKFSLTANLPDDARHTKPRQTAKSTSSEISNLPMTPPQPKPNSPPPTVYSNKLSPTGAKNSTAQKPKPFFSNQAPLLNNAGTPPSPHFRPSCRGHLVRHRRSMARHPTSMHAGPTLRQGNRKSMVYGHAPGTRGHQPRQTPGPFARNA